MEKKCCICKKELNGYGNNAYPIKEGICCDTCNAKFVIPGRLFPIKMNNAISYEIVRNHKEYQDITSELEKRDFEIVEKIPFMTLYSNVETEEKVVVCIV